MRERIKRHVRLAGLDCQVPKFYAEILWECYVWINYNVDGTQVLTPDVDETFARTRY